MWTVWLIIGSYRLHRFLGGNDYGLHIKNLINQFSKNQQEVYMIINMHGDDNFSGGALLQFVFNHNAELNYNENDKSYTHGIAFLIDQICPK